MQLLRRLSTVFIPLVFAASLTAQTTINFLFSSEGSYQGVSALPGSSASDRWNVLGGSPDINMSLTMLRDVSEEFTPVSLYMHTATFENLRLGGLPNSGLPIFTSYAHSDGRGAMTFNLSGLEEGGVYNLYVYAARDLSYYGPEATESNTIAFDAEQPFQTSYTSAQTSEFIEGTNYVQLANLNADKSGNLSFNVSGIINGFTLVSRSGEVAVPEPSTYAAMAGGLAMGFALWRRRSRKA